MTALKTLTMYLRAAKTEAEEAGIETEEMASSVSKLRSQLLELTGNRLDIMLDEDTFKSTFQILKELSEIWDDISDVSQANILSLIGGKRNANVVTSILRNFQDAANAAVTAANSAGSAWAENEKYLQGIEGKTKQLQASFQAFANSVIGSGIVKAFTDIANGILSTATALNKVNMLIPTVVALGVAIRTIRANTVANEAASKISLLFGQGGDLNVIQQQANNVVLGLTNMQRQLVASKLQMMGASAEAKSYGASLATAGTAAGAMSTGVQALTIKTQGLGAAFKALKSSVSIWIMLATLVVSAITSVVNGINEANERAKQAAKDAYESYKSSSDKYKSDLASLNKIRERFNELKDKANENAENLGLANDEYSEFMGYIDQIVGVSPDLVAAYTEQGYVLKNEYTKALDDATESLSKLIEESEMAQANSWRFDNAKTAADEIEEAWKEYTKSAKASKGSMLRWHDIFPDPNEEPEMAQSWVSAWNNVLNKLDIDPIVVDIQYNPNDWSWYDGTYEFKYWWDEWSADQSVNAKNVIDWYAKVYTKASTIISELGKQIDENGNLIFKNEDLDRIYNAIVGRFSNAAGVVRKYTDQMAVDMENIQIILKYGQTTKDEFRQVLDSDYYAQFAKGMEDAFDFGDSQETKIAKAKAYLDDFFNVLRQVDDILYFKSSGGQDAIDKLEALKGQFEANSPAAALVAAAIENVKTAMAGASNEVDNLTRSYEDLEAAMQNASSASTLLEKIRKGTIGLEELVPDLVKLADAWNKMFGGDEKQWTDFLSFGEDGAVDWDATAAGIENYIDAMVDAGFKDTEFANLHGDAIATIKQNMKVFSEAASSTFELSDAMSGLNAAMKFKESDLSDESSAVEVIEDAINLMNEYNKAVEHNKISGAKLGLSDFLTIDANGIRRNVTTAEAYYDTMVELLVVEVPEDQRESARKTLKAAFEDIVAEIEEAEYTISDAMSGLNAALSFKSSALDEDKSSPVDVMKDAIDMMNEYNKAVDAEIVSGPKLTVSDFISIDGDEITRNLNALDLYVSAVIEKLIVDVPEDKKEEARSTLRTYFDTIIQEVENATIELEDAMSGFNNAVSFKKSALNIDEDESPADVIEDAIDMLEDYNNAVKAGVVNGGQLTLGDLLTIDESGVRRNVDRLGAYVDAMVEIQTAGILDETAREDAKNALREYYNGIVTTVEESASRASDAMSAFNKAISFKQSAVEISDDDTPAKIIEDAMSMLEAYNKAIEDGMIAGEKLTLDDFISFDDGAMRRNLENVETYIEAMIEIMTEDISDDLARANTQEALRSYFNGIVEAVEDATFELSDAISGFSSALSFKQDAFGANAEDSPAKVIEDAVKMLESYNKAVDAGRILTEKASLDDFLTIDADGIRRNIDQMDAYVDAMVEIQTAGIEDETRREEAKAVLREYYDEIIGTVKEATFEISDAVSGFNTAISFKQASLDVNADETPAQVLEDALNMLETYNKAVEAGKLAAEPLKLEDLIIVDETGIRRNIDQIDTYVNAMIEMQTAGIEDEEVRAQTQDTLREFYNNLKDVSGAADEVTDSFTKLGSAYTFMRDHMVGERVGDITTVYQDLEKLKELVGEDSINISDFIRWDEGIGDFVYRATNLQDEIDSLATTIATELVDAEIAAGRAMEDALRAEEIEKYANRIKESLGGVVDAWSQISNVVGNVKSVKSFKDAIGAEDADTLNLLSDAVSLAQEFGLNLEDIVSFDALGKIVFSADALNVALEDSIDNLVKEGLVAEELAEQLKQAAREQQAMSTAQTGIGDAYDKWSAKSGSRDYIDAQQLTYSQYKELIEADERYANALQYSNGQLSINAQKYNEITAAIGAETIAVAKLHVEENKRKVNDLVEEYKTLGKTEGDRARAIMQEIRRLTLETQGYAVLATEIDNATSAMNRFLNASTQVNDESYDAAASAFEIIRQTLYDAENEMYMMTGREQFKEAMRFVIGDNIEVDGAEFKKAFKAAERYLSDGRTGLQNFVDDLFKFNIVDAGGNLNMSLDAISQKLGISKDSVASLLKQLNQLDGFNIDLSDETGDATEDIKSWFEQLSELMTTIDTFEETGVDFKVSDNTQEQLKALQEQMDAINETIQAINAGINLGASGTPEPTEPTPTSVTTNVITEGAEESKEALEGVQEAAESIPEETKTTISEDGSKGLVDALKEIIGLENSASRTVAPSSNAKGLNIVRQGLADIINKINQINNMTVRPRGGLLLGGGLWTGTMGAEGGKTLVGELGQEMVVDVHNGRYYTVGTHGPEIVNVPKDAIVYNHLVTAKLLGRNTASRNGAYTVTGRSKALGDEVGQALATGTLSKTVPGAGSSASKASEELAESLEDIAKKYEEINKNLEHMIEHLEHSYYVSERALDYDSMAGVLAAQAREYQNIIDNCEQGIRELLGNGADDTTEQVQSLEGAMWDAYQNMYATMDRIRDLYKEALTDQIDGIQNAYKNLVDALKEYNDTGEISVDTFQQLIENGVQYLSFLKDENGQYNINEREIQNLITARKNQLAVETALAYVDRIREATQNHEVNRINELVDATQAIGSGTWDYVYAQAALLKTQGLSNDQYEQLIENLRNLQQLADIVGNETTGDTQDDALEKIKNRYEDLNKELEHYIEHQDRAYNESERAADYFGMEQALRNKIAYWQQIVQNSQAALDETKEAGATDLDQEVQDMEKAIWDASDRINEAMDSIRSMLTDALSQRLKDIESAFSTMSSAVTEFNENGHISINTFESLIDGGIEYLGLLKKENGQYVINEASIRAMVNARKEQLAIESALSYVDRIREALQKGETEKVKQLTDLSETLSENSWSAVYANIAYLKTLGLEEAQYQRILDNVEALQQIASDVSLGSSNTEESNALDDILTKYSDLNEQIEHYIKHQQFAYTQAERALNHDEMTSSLMNQVTYYEEIMRNAQAGIQEMLAEGADDTDKALQDLEQAYWDAYNSMYSALDNIRKLKVDALTAKIDGLQGAFRNLENAANEYNERGGITLDTFQSLIASGVQYMSLLDEQNGQYVISKDRVREYIAAEKEHLAIETALSYISNIREALQNGEVERLKNLVDLTNKISNGTWDYVYAQAALLKAQGLSEAMYDTLLRNLDKLRSVTASTASDISSAESNITEEYKNQQDALDKILDYTEDLIKAEADDRIDAINEEIDAYKEIIELKKKSLEASKTENEYQEEVAKRAQEIAKLQAKYDMLALDNSRSAAAERLKLQDEIAEKQQDLASYQQDYSYNAQVEALEQEAEAYEKSKQEDIRRIEESVSSQEKIYQLAIARIRDQWDTLYDDLIAWNTEQGNVINQEITDNWEKACSAVRKYGSYVEAVSAISGTSGSGNVVVADKLPRYHSGGVVGKRGAINDHEVMAILEKGELVVNDKAKAGLYAAVSAVEFLESLGKKIGSTIRNVGNLNPLSAFTPAFAGMAAPESQGYVTHQDVAFTANFNVQVSGVTGESDAKRIGEQIANSAINNLYDVFNRKGISFTSKLRQN